jgi:hypothetical protein
VEGDSWTALLTAGGLALVLITTLCGLFWKLGKIDTKIDVPGAALATVQDTVRRLVEVENHRACAIAETRFQDHERKLELLTREIERLRKLLEHEK